MSDLAIFAAFAEELADAARAEALGWRAEDWGIEDKGAESGFDPVTRVDRAVERVLRERIAARWPEHGLQGEEYGSTLGAGRYVWSLDPIDGTRAFICGLPSWTILIALLDEGRPVVGIIDVPVLTERYAGFSDSGHVSRGSARAPLRTSGCEALAGARLATTDPYLFEPGERAAFDRVRAQVPLTRYGLDAYAYARLAAGGIDLVIESRLAPHDLNALIPVVIAAGGAVGDWDGGMDFRHGRIVAAASEPLLRAAVAELAARERGERMGSAG